MEEPARGSATRSLRALRLLVLTAALGLLALGPPFVAAARPTPGNPFLVVLDEPNSNLDSEGDAALSKAVLSVRARGGVVVIVAHRPIGIESADLVMVLKDGRVQAFGPKDSVLGQVLQRPAVAGPAIKIVSDKGGSQP